MASVNKVIIVGNLGADPETRYLPSGEAVTNIRVATTDRWKDKASGEQKEATARYSIAFFGRPAEGGGRGAGRAGRRREEREQGRAQGRCGQEARRQVRRHGRRHPVLSGSVGYNSPANQRHRNADLRIPLRRMRLPGRVPAKGLGAADERLPLLRQGLVREAPERCGLPVEGQWLVRDRLPEQRQEAGRQAGLKQGRREGRGEIGREGRGEIGREGRGEIGREGRRRAGERTGRLLGLHDRLSAQYTPDRPGASRAFLFPESAATSLVP